MTRKTTRAAHILDTALQLAEKRPWETLRLHDIAQAMPCSLEEIRSCYAQKEDLIDAWFDRADQAMLQDAAAPDFAALPPLERIERAMMSWLLALAPHQRVTRQMLLGRLEPGHLHIQWAGVMRISRTVQWMREAALRHAAYLSRALEETLLTSLYLATLAHWLLDHSDDYESTRRALQRRLRRLEPILRLTEGDDRLIPVPAQMHRPRQPREAPMHH